ncbi:MAG: 2-amino-4-hydroxy-6-hydroxymethyldihydropteridine diphosphokinase [Bacteroidales bacterium]
MSVVHLLLGSNQGDKVTILRMATEKLQKLSEKPVLVSSLYESEPWGFEAKEWFVNQAVKIDTSLKPRDLLDSVLNIEKSLGRVRSEMSEGSLGYSSRTIDIDILLYENLITNTVDLKIPHPKMYLRRFVLMPLSEIDPGLIHPVFNKSVKRLLEECKDKSKVRIISITKDMSTVNNLKWRYATKRFDTTKKVSAENLEILKEAVNLAPTSYGLQPFKIIILENQKIREKLKEAAWGQPQLTEASQIFLFCNFTEMGPEKVDEYLRLRSKINNQNFEETKSYGDMMKGQIAVMTPEQLSAWTAKQAYIALGILIAAASELQIDTCPMEGFDKSKFDEILGLRERGLTATVIAAIGYRSPEDRTQDFIKTRKPLDKVFEMIK